MCKSQEESFEDRLSSGARLSGEEWEKWLLSHLLVVILFDVGPESTLPSHKEWQSPKVTFLIFRQIMRQADLGLRAQAWV